MKMKILESRQINKAQKLLQDLLDDYASIYHTIPSWDEKQLPNEYWDEDDFDDSFCLILDPVIDNNTDIAEKFNYFFGAKRMYGPVSAPGSGIVYVFLV